MQAKILMTVEEYLRTSFEDADCEYLDGEVVERNVGELQHASAQGQLIYLLRQMASRLDLQVFPEIRIQISSRRFRVADIAVWRAGNIGDRVPVVPPVLVIEVLSSEDRIIRVQTKIQEYLSIGAQWIWLIDPQEKQAICYSQRTPAGAPCDVLRMENPHIEIPLEQVFPPRAS